MKCMISQEKKNNLHDKSNFRAILIVLGQFFLYVACLFGAVTDYSIFANISFSICLGLVIGQFFIVGHDACHQSLAKNMFLNKIIGRFSFSFALHSYTLWALEHNQKHHGNTNIKGKDPSWPPMTKEEFDQTNNIRRWLERFYRSPFGAGAYYLHEMWFKNHILPTSSTARSEWRKYMPDALFVLFSFIAQLYIIQYLGSVFAPSKSEVEILLLGWLVPFLCWNWIMGVVIYLQHTHPKIPWMTENQKLPFSQVQMYVTPHVVFPEPIGMLLYNIMEHTAHHLQTSVPSYNLYLAQKQLEEVHNQNMLIYQWTPAEYIQITKICKLYDFQQKCWTDFDGNPTSSAVPHLWGSIGVSPDRSKNDAS